jgi:hypothetical protein
MLEFGTSFPLSKPCYSLGQLVLHSIIYILIFAVKKKSLVVVAHSLMHIFQHYSHFLGKSTLASLKYADPTLNLIGPTCDLAAHT